MPISKIHAGMVVIPLAIAAAPAAAWADLDDVDLVIYTGIGRGGAALGDDAPAQAPRCGACERSAIEVPGDAPAAADDRVGVIAFGLAGTEGHVRGGVEIVSTLRFDDHASGHSALVTSAGIDRGRAFLMAGLGVGSYWGEAAESLGRLGGTAHAELGVRLSRRVVLVGRTDVVINSELAVQLFSVGLQWAPASVDWVAHAEPDGYCGVVYADRASGRRSPLEGQPAVR